MVREDNTRNKCHVKCPYVIKSLRAAIAKNPSLVDEISSRRKIPVTRGAKRVVEPEEKPVEWDDRGIDFVDEKELIIERTTIEIDETTDDEIDQIFGEPSRKTQPVDSRNPQKRIEEAPIVEQPIIRPRYDDETIQETYPREAVVDEITVEPTRKVPVEEEIYQTATSTKPEVTETKAEDVERRHPQDDRELPGRVEPWKQEEGDKESRKVSPPTIAGQVSEGTPTRISPQEISIKETKIHYAEPGPSTAVEDVRPVKDDACEDACPLMQEQKERIMLELEEQQRIVDRYYLSKDAGYFEDTCTCSLACVLYTLSRNPFVRSIFASLALFAVGLKLCSELDAWEMPSYAS